MRHTSWCRPCSREQWRHHQILLFLLSLKRKLHQTHRFHGRTFPFLSCNSVGTGTVPTRYETPILRSDFIVPFKSPGNEGLLPFLSVSKFFNGKAWSTSRFNSAILCSCNLPPDLPSKGAGFYRVLRNEF